MKKHLIIILLALSMVFTTVTYAFALPAQTAVALSEYQVIATGWHTLVVKADGTLWAWGFNTKGNLGDGTAFDKLSPIPIKIMDDVISVSEGYLFSLAVKTDGSLWAWGDNEYGKLGDGTTTGRYTPVKIMDDVVFATTGNEHSFAIKKDGSLWAWGNNFNGQLGDGTKTERHNPIKIMDNVAHIAAGAIYSLAVKTDGALWAWGNNLIGQLGDGSKTDRLEPVKIMDGVALVAASKADYSFAIKTDGTLWAWGNNPEGALGDGTQEYRTTPVKVLEDAAYVCVGDFHSLAIKTDGSLWTWGMNRYMQLGDGTGGDIGDYRATPLKIMDNVATVAASFSRSYAVKTDGSLWAWGEYNWLSDGTTETSSTPVKIMDGMKLPDGSPNTAPEIPSTDVPSSWAETEVYAAIEAGLVPENLRKNYRNDVTRGEVAQMFIILIEKSTQKSIDTYMVDRGVTIDNNAFTDTNDKNVLAANSLSIINGVGDNRFDPNGVLTRAQIAAIINRVAHVMDVNTDGYTHSFTDVNGHWVSDELGWPVHAKIIEGIGNNMFNPNGNLTTEQAIAITYRALATLAK